MMQSLGILYNLKALEVFLPSLLETLYQTADIIHNQYIFVDCNYLELGILF